MITYLFKSLFIFASVSISDCLNNSDIINLHENGLCTEVILLKIEQTRETCFDLSTDSMIFLKSTGLDQSIIKAMLKKKGVVLRRNNSFSGRRDNERTRSPRVH